METNAKKPTLFSAIKPSGALTLGSYLGAISNWNRYIESYDSILCIADLHTITVRIPPTELRNNSLTQLAYYIACGIDPARCVLFIQSHVPAHAELAWVLGCYSMFGELSRMTQFKDKSAKNEENINAGLFTYPALMAADILLYQTDIVPVGDDQRQHVELCRDVATRFNGVYGETFRLPETVLPPVAARVMSLADPSSKMSKSDSGDQAGCIFLADSKDDIVRKFKRAVTDSEAAVYYDEENKKGVSNLMSIYSAVTGIPLTKSRPILRAKAMATLSLPWPRPFATG